MFYLIVLICYIMLPMKKWAKISFSYFSYFILFIFNLIPRKFVDFLIIIQAFTILCYVLIVNNTKIVDIIPNDFSNNYEMKQVYSFIDETIPNDTIVFTKPRVLNLFSNAVKVPEKLKKQ